MYRIGVFDSGMGGKSVANALQHAMPTNDVLYVNDSKNVPYGTKSPEQLLTLVLPILQELARKTDVIVIACNTVSTTLIDTLRQTIATPLIPVEPMVESAIQQTKSKVIAVCATPTTLASKRYAQLKETYAQETMVIEPDCSDWAYMIETDQLDRYKIFTLVDDVCARNADVIVLGCTHYHWIENIIQETAGNRAVILQPESSIIEEVRRVLALLG